MGAQGPTGPTYQTIATWVVENCNVVQPCSTHSLWCWLQLCSSGKPNIVAMMTFLFGGVFWIRNHQDLNGRRWLIPTLEDPVTRDHRNILPASIQHRQFTAQDKIVLHFIYIYSFLRFTSWNLITLHCIASHQSTLHHFLEPLNQEITGILPYGSEESLEINWLCGLPGLRQITWDLM